MPTSGTAQAARQPRAAAAAPGGFTLLEMVVVLAILGLVAAVAIPSTVRGIQSWRRQAQLDALMDQVRGLPSRARASGEAIVIDAATLGGNAPPLRVEEGWRLGVPSPWGVRANGVCEGGILELEGAGAPVVLEIASPFCEPRLPEG